MAVAMKLLLTLCLAVPVWQVHHTRNAIECHDVVGHRLHWRICSLHGFSTVTEWWRQNPRPVEDSDRIKLLWDFTIITDRTIHANRPDL